MIDPNDKSTLPLSGIAQAVQDSLNPDNTGNCDPAWLESLPYEVQIIAKRYGQSLTQFVLTAGAVNWAVNGIAQTVHSIPQAITAIQVIARAFDSCMTELATLKGFTGEQLNIVKQDVERTSTLANIEPSTRKNSAGIILPSH